MSVVLGHEAYRDGTLTDNKQETREAVIAHTLMAARMRAEGSDFSGSFVGLDLAVYDYARSVGNVGIMAKYADALYDSSGDFWKLTKDGRLINDGHARVVDENGKEIISLEDLRMSEERDTIGALAKMFGISREKAAEINKANNGSIQLGRGAGIGGDDYVNALKYTLSGTVNNMSDTIFNGMTTDERAQYLKHEVIIGSAFIGSDKGAVAAKLRDIKGLHNENILTGLFYTVDTITTERGMVTVKYNPAANYDFMNEPLREFLNLNLNGSSEYAIADIIADKRFSSLPFGKSLYHLDPNYRNVTKYVHEDGREVIWGINKLTNEYEQINSELYRGTFNYADAENRNAFKMGPHYLFDMDPFDNKYGTNAVTAAGSGIRYLAEEITNNTGKTLSKSPRNEPKSLGELILNIYRDIYKLDTYNMG
jgi:hypothetical protein